MTRNNGIGFFSLTNWPGFQGVKVFWEHGSVVLNFYHAGHFFAMFHLIPQDHSRSTITATIKNITTITAIIEKT